MRSLWLVTLAACGGASTTAPISPEAAALAPLTLTAEDKMVTIPAGKSIAGSTPEEREQAYADYERAAGHSTARDQQWFDGEEERHPIRLPGFKIDLLPVTQAQYGEFVAAGKAPPPAITEAEWKAQGFRQDYATQVARFVWKDGRPPVGREDHPVVLVTWSEAQAYCKWRGELRGEPRRLPSAQEYERAARGKQAFAYPWGNVFDATKLNSAAAGPGDTEAVGTRVEGASPDGVLELAGNVFQWTGTPWDADEMTVKGSAWEDHAGLGRGASAHGRPPSARHVIVGFRCAGDAPAP